MQQEEGMPSFYFDQRKTSIYSPYMNRSYVYSISFQVSGSLIVSGPLWTGPLHNAAYIKEMLNLAEQWGWAGPGTGTDLEKLLKQMVDESDPELPFGYIKLDEVLMQICLSIFRSLIRLSMTIMIYLNSIF